MRKNCRSKRRRWANAERRSRRYHWGRRSRSPHDEIDGTVVGGVTRGSITKPNGPISLSPRNEIAPLVLDGTLAAGRSDAFDKAGMKRRIDRRNDDPVSGMVAAKLALVLYLDARARGQAQWIRCIGVGLGMARATSLAEARCVRGERIPETSPRPSPIRNTYRTSLALRKLHRQGIADEMEDRHGPGRGISRTTPSA